MLQSRALGMIRTYILAVLKTAASQVFSLSNMHLFFYSLQ